MADADESFAAGLVPGHTSWSSDAEPWKMLKETRHGEFVLNGKLRKYAFMTDEDASNQLEIQRLLAVWKLKPPNLIVQLNGHNTTFNNFVSEEMCSEQQDFIDLKARLGKDVGKPELSEHLYNRVMNVYSNLAVACDMTNCWFFSAGMPLCNWMMLGDALETSKATPTILAAQELEEFTCGAYPTSDALQDLYCDLFKASVPLKEKPRRRPRKTLDRSSYGDAMEEEAKQEWYSKACEAVGSFSASSQPNWWILPARDEEYKVEEEQVKFQFIAPNTVATHFIYTSKSNSLDPSLLGNAGWVFVAGGWYWKGHEIRNAMAHGDPAILVDNTGGETQQYARLITKVLDLQTQGHTILDIQGQVADILAFACQGTAEVPTSQLGMDQLTLPEVLRIIDMVYERPSYFQETLVTVDVLKDSAESIVNKAARSFASRATHGFELGAGNADQASVLQAWRIHQVLSATAARLNARDTFIMAGATIFTFLGTCSSISKMFFEEENAPSWNDIKHDVGNANVVAALKFLVSRGTVLFPALATIFSGLLTALRYNSKAAALSVTAGKIIGEIYHFRMRVSGYEVTANVSSEQKKENQRGDGEEIAETAEQNTSVLLRRSRSHFAKTTRALVEDLTKGNAAEADMAYGKTLKEKDLAQYVDMACYGQKGFIKSSNDDSGNGYQPLLTEVWQVEHLGNMTSAAFFHTRTVPTLKTMKATLPRISCWELVLNMCLIVLSTMATVLAAVDLDMWVPLLFAAAALVKAFLEYSNCHAHRVSLLKAVATLTSLETWWASLAGVDKGLPATRDELVNTTESVILEVLSARMGVMVSRKVSPQASGSKDSEKGGDETKKDA